MNTILIGHAELIDTVQPRVRLMLANEGIYIAGDSARTDATVVLASQGGKVFSMQIDSELAPDRFLDTLTLHGPYIADDEQRVYPQNVTVLEGLRDAVLAPREIKRDVDGWLSHPALPVCDEDVRVDKLLDAFGVETDFVSMEIDAPHLIDDDTGDIDCASWNPTPPVGDGWMLLEIYDTEDGAYALFGRRKPVPVAMGHRARRAQLTLDAIEASVKELVARAEAAKVVVTINTVAQEPLAMGNYVMQAHVRAARWV
jgi:hypothetical protein